MVEILTEDLGLTGGLDVSFEKARGGVGRWLWPTRWWWVFKLIYNLSLIILFAQLSLAAPTLAEEGSEPQADSAVTELGDEDTKTAASSLPTAVPEAPVVTAEPIQAQATSALTWLVLALALAAAVGSSATALVVFRWRRAVGDGQFSILPNKVIEQMETLKRGQREQQSELHEALRYVVELSQQTNRQYDALTEANREINEILGIFQESLSEKDSEIRKLRQGGEREVFRQYLSRLLRLARILGEEIQDVADRGGDPAPLQAVEQVLGDVLDDCGVEAFAPSKGAALRESEGVADQPGFIETDDPEQHLTIAEILQPGFRFRTGGSPIVLQEAKVTVFVFGREEE